MTATALERHALDLEWETRRRRKAAATAVVRVSERYGEWIAAVRPEYRWDYPHFLLMQQTLDAITSGDIRRAMFNVAIRHGKTEHNSIGYGSYTMERRPRFRLIVASYNQPQADKLSREIRRLVKSRGVALSEERNTAREWETLAGGSVRALGAGAGAASLNADGIIIDDPIGSRDEAESPAHRDRVWDWMTNDIFARAEPHTWILFTMSRWHQDDPAGRLIDQQGRRWRVIDLPGRAEANDALGRVIDAPLWPELRGDEWLTEKRAELGEYGFASLIQGRPRPREGGMFKWAWWQLIAEVPKSGPMIRYFDLAGTQPKARGHDPDYTAGALLCRMPDKRTAIVDIERFRLSIAARDAKLVELARADLAAYPGRVRWWLEAEAGIAGADRTADLVRRLQAVGMPVSTEHPTGKKVHRAEPLASAAEAQNVVLCPDRPGCEWRDAFRAEAADFPNGRHDDQIDAAAGAYAKLSSPIPAVSFGNWDM